MPTASGKFEHGQTTVGTTEVQLTSTSSKAVFGVLVVADDANTGIVYLGKKGVSTTTGLRLDAGDGVNIEIDDPSKIYLIATATGQKVQWISV